MGNSNIAESVQISDMEKQKHRVLVQKSWEREPRGSREVPSLAWSTNTLSSVRGKPREDGLWAVKTNGQKARTQWRLGIIHILRLLMQSSSFLPTSWKPSQKVSHFSKEWNWSLSGQFAKWCYSVSPSPRHWSLKGLWTWSIAFRSLIRWVLWALARKNKKQKKNPLEMENKSGRGWKGSLQSYVLMEPNEVT